MGRTMTAKTAAKQLANRINQVHHVENIMIKVYESGILRGLGINDEEWYLQMQKDAKKLTEINDLISKYYPIDDNQEAELNGDLGEIGEAVLHKLGWI